MPNFSIRSRLIFLSVLLLGDPRRLLRASDPRACPRLAKPQRGSEACFDSPERQFGQQALWRSEILGDRLRRHAARPLSASGGTRQVGARLRSEGDFRRRSRGRRGDRRRSLHHDRSWRGRRASPIRATTAPPATPCLAQAKSHVMAIEDQIDKIVDRLEQQAVARRDASRRARRNSPSSLRSPGESELWRSRWASPRSPFARSPSP